MSPLAKRNFIDLAASVETVRRMLILVLLASGAALVHILVGGLPETARPADPYSLPVASALALDGILWIDGRTEAAFEEDHFPGAVHLSHDNWQSGFGQLLEQWDPAMAIVVYCDGDGCESSQAMAAELRSDLGVENIYWLEGGWVELRKVIPEK